MEKTNTSRHLLLFSQCWRCFLWTSIGPTCVHLCPPDTLCKQQSKCSQQVQGLGGAVMVLWGIWAELGVGSLWLSSPMGAVRNSGGCSVASAMTSQLCAGIKKKNSIFNFIFINYNEKKIKKNIGRKRWLVINTGSKNNHAGATKGAYSNTWSMLVSVIYKMLREGYKK